MLALDVDRVGMVRGRGGKGGAEDQYVNDTSRRRFSLDKKNDDESLSGTKANPRDRSSLLRRR